VCCRWRQWPSLERWLWRFAVDFLGLSPPFAVREQLWPHDLTAPSWKFLLLGETKKLLGDMQLLFILLENPNSFMKRREPLEEETSSRLEQIIWLEIKFVGIWNLTFFVQLSSHSLWLLPLKRWTKSQPKPKRIETRKRNRLNHLSEEVIYSRLPTLLRALNRV
jgi:hypothetical protein